MIVIARCRVQYNMNVCHKHYKHFEWKRLHVANNTNVLNGKELPWAWWGGGAYHTPLPPPQTLAESNGLRSTNGSLPQN